MNFNLKKEFPLILIVLIPFVYLFYIWDGLPDKVPVHWGSNGEIDRYGDKIELLLFPFLLPLFTYLTLLIIPKYDPKDKIKNMGGKYHSFKLLITTMMSVIAVFIIYSSKNASNDNSHFIVILLGFLFMILGNYFKTLKTNYFIGLKTPWTLENEEVWKKTHQVCGKIWFVAGLIVIISGIVFEPYISFKVLIAIALIIAVIPYIYSYTQFKKIKNSTDEKK